MRCVSSLCFACGIGLMSVPAVGATPVFKPPQIYAIAGGPKSIGVWDWNHDGCPDLVVTRSLSDSLEVLIGACDGEFSRASGIKVPPNPKFVACGDLDGDGTIDCVCAQASGDVSGDITVVLNPAPRATSVTTYHYGGRWLQVALGDLDEDGDLDVVAANSYTGWLSLFANDGQGGLVSVPGVYFGGGLSGIAVGRFDENASVDLVAIGGGMARLNSLRGHGDLTFDLVKIETQPCHSGIASARLDDDDALDIIVGDIYTSSSIPAVSAFRGSGNGWF